jgi:FMN phosphatase YigB (HAD superfamily)
LVGIRAVFFDIGETLVDETRHWSLWADWLGIPRLTFFGVLGGVISRGEDHQHVFEFFRPGLDLEREGQLLREAGRNDDFGKEDLYADAVPCLQELRRSGRMLGLAGNQPKRMVPALAGLGLPVDVIASSAEWDLWKPDRAFFRRIVQEANLPASSIAYVGDRVDNDVVPAAEVGLATIFLVRGPWGFLQRDDPGARAARAVIGSLAELPGVLERIEQQTLTHEASERNGS